MPSTTQSDHRDHHHQRHLHHRTHTRPPTVKDQYPQGSVISRFNTFLAIKVTQGVGTMWCAYAFAGLAFVSLPAAIRSHDAVTLVSWISQTFLQLVLLSIIIVGQNVQSAAADARAEATYEDAESVLKTALEIQRNMKEQDAAIERILAEVLELKR